MQISTICEIEFQQYMILNNTFFETSFKGADSHLIMNHVEEHTENQMSDLIKSSYSKRPFCSMTWRKGSFEQNIKYNNRLSCTVRRFLVVNIFLGILLCKHFELSLFAWNFHKNHVEPRNVILLSAKTIMKAVLNLKRSAQYA